MHGYLKVASSIIIIHIMLSWAIPNNLLHPPGTAGYIRQENLEKQVAINTLTLLHKIWGQQQQKSIYIHLHARYNFYVV
jgi:hypothetical protein